MKRALFDTVAVLPFESGSITPRLGYESAILAVTVATGTTTTVKVEHSDTEDGTFEAVPDSRLFIDNPVDKDGNAIITNDAPADAVANLNIDLAGCKEFIKITFTGSTPTDNLSDDPTDDSETTSAGTFAALVLGDATNHPVSL